MKKEDRSGLAFGLILILVGMIILAYRIFPGIRQIIAVGLAWPLIIVGFGFLLLLIGAFSKEPEMAMPAMFFVGLGGLLYWQNQTGNWFSWAYAWTLFPGFVGAGQILSKLLGSQKPDAVADGLRSILISAILFVIFGTFLGNLNIMGPYWPVLLIAAGIIILSKPLLQKRN